MLPAMREHLRAIWQCLSHTCWFVLSHGMVKAFERGEDGWKALEEFLDPGDLEGKATQAEGISGQERERKEKQQQACHLLRAPQKLWERMWRKVEMMRMKVERMRRRTRTTEMYD